MHVAFVQLEYNHFKDPDQLFDGSFTVVEWAKALNQIGVEVTVVYRFSEDIFFKKEGINFYLFKDSLSASVNWYQVHFRFYSRLRELLKKSTIDVIQVHNLKSMIPNLFLTRYFSKTPVLVQDHGSVLNERNSLKSKIYNLALRLSLSKADAIMFSSKGQERVWVQKGVLKRAKCVFVMENSSSFHPLNKEASKNLTGLNDETIFLWVGNLNQNKDPFTVLTAFSKFFKKEKKAKLYMIYREGDLEKQISQAISNEATLKGRVKMLGKIERGRLIDDYSSSDFIVSGSHKEGSGYSVIEAMSCGVIPILTSIPSFLELTNGGNIGEVYQVGESEMLEKALDKVYHMDRVSERSKVLRHFQENLSYESLAFKALRVYQNLI